MHSDASSSEKDIVELKAEDISPEGGSSSKESKPSLAGDIGSNKPTEFMNKDDLEKVTESEVFVQKRLFSFLYSKKVPEIPLQDERKVYPMYKANFISRIFFLWVIPLLKVGYKRTLQPNDLYLVDEHLKIEKLHAEFLRNLGNMVAKDRAKYKKQNPTATDEELDAREFPKKAVLKALALTFKWQYGFAILFVILSNAASACSPLLTKKLIFFVEAKQIFPQLKVNKGIGYAIGVALIMLFNGIMFNHFFHNSMMTGAQVRSVLLKSVLNKSFRLSGPSKHKYPSGKITSLMSTDLSRLDLAIMFQPFLIGFPVPVIICVVLLIINLGPIALSGIGVFFFVVFGTMIMFKRLFRIRRKTNVFTDARVTLMREILNSMKMIKFYAWEDAYEKNVQERRAKEIHYVRVMQYSRTALVALAYVLPNLSSMVAFVAMYKIGRKQNPADIFASLSLFQVLALQMFFIPMAMSTGIDGMVGLDRVQKFLEAEEEHPDDIEDKKCHVLDINNAFEMEKGTFEWEEFEDEEEEDPKDKRKGRPVEKKEVKAEKEANKEKSTFSGFHDLSFDIKRGEFVIITGPIGSGKSSLLNAMSGFMKRISGQIRVQGHLLLCGYPWVQNATVRDNIIFGSEFDQQRYDQVINCCSLQADLDILPAGDETEIGERGITLSGGQKARINLARAVYKSDVDVLLFDDVLSAVDARVGKHIMDECMMGMLRGKTRVLATHQLSLIQRADRVIFLDSHGKFDIGTVDQLKSRQPEFVSLMEYSTATSEDDEDEQEEAEQMAEVKRQITSTKARADGRITAREERAVNSISWKVYFNYVKAGKGALGWLGPPLYIFLLFATGFTSIFSSIWLSFWTSRKFPDLSNNAYMGLYIMFIFATIILMMIQFLTLCYIGVTASKVLNLQAVNRLLHTPMSFMDTTPLGRVLNRFTKDTDACDNELVDQIRLFLYQCVTMLAVIIMCIVYLPWFAIAVPFLAFIFILAADHYQSSAREIKRLEAVQRSFVYNNFNEILGGMNTIKAYRSQNRFSMKSDFLIDRMNEATYLSIATQRWVAISLVIVSVIFALVITLLCVTRQFKISASSAGVLLTYTLQLPGLMNTLLRAMTQTENDMNSVERLVTYATELPQEAEYHSLTRQPPPPEWPQQGGISFKNVSLAYRPELPLVLKNLTMDVKPGEKIGICGRTGAGKSTIMSALYRLTELREGNIEIDGLDIANMGLYDLRSKLSIIPQDPVLFRGSIRKNLDPFSQLDDSLLWDALVSGGAINEGDLELVKKQDKSASNMHKFHLDQEVEDEGTNFSLGERQLLALTRALVRQSKILILDEATSSVDYETDAKIQSKIVEAFSQCTILCIAHRLKTILQYDRILVLEKGEIAEFATPWELYQQGGIFREMCERSGIVANDFNRK